MRVSAAEEYLKMYGKILTEMPQREICEELSFLHAVKMEATDRYDDYQSMASYLIDSMFDACHDEVLARVISGSLKPMEVNVI